MPADSGRRCRLQLDPQTSVRMAGVRQKDTAAELAVRRALTAIGLRYRVRNRDLPGTPDVANRARRWVIFVHGCFWHRHAGCTRTTTPQRNRQFWEQKFAANVARDRRAVASLRRRGFRVLVVWECQTLEPALLCRRLAAWSSRTGIDDTRPAHAS
jgi:DNA mismatch endonuclease (patch repair protein)